MWSNIRNCLPCCSCRSSGDGDPRCHLDPTGGEVGEAGHDNLAGGDEENWSGILGVRRVIQERKGSDGRQHSSVTTRCLQCSLRGQIYYNESTFYHNWCLKYLNVNYLILTKLHKGLMSIEEE